MVRRAEGPAAPTAVAVYQQQGANGSAALQVAAQLAVSERVQLVLAGGHGRRDRTTLAELGKHGIDVSAGEVPDGALIVGGEADADAHLIVHARPDEAADNIDEWVNLVSAERQV